MLSIILLYSRKSYFPFNFLQTFMILRSVKELQVTPKTDVFAFGVVLAELITGGGVRLKFREMKSLITVVSSVEKI